MYNPNILTLISKFHCISKELEGKVKLLIYVNWRSRVNCCRELNTYHIYIYIYMCVYTQLRLHNLPVSSIRNY